MLVLAGPPPSSLYKNAKLLPGDGGSSYIESEFLNTVETISKSIVLPSMFLVKPYTGISVFNPLILYCSVATPAITFLSCGRPNCIISFIDELIILINCSYQLALLGSFHNTVCPDKFLPLLSIISSVVLTAENFNNPLAGIFRLGL